MNIFKSLIIILLGLGDLDIQVNDAHSIWDFGKATIDRNNTPGFPNIYKVFLLESAKSIYCCLVVGDIFN